MKSPPIRVKTNHMCCEFLHPSCVCMCVCECEMWVSGRLCGSHVEGSWAGCLDGGSADGGETEGGDGWRIRGGAEEK